MVIGSERRARRRGRRSIGDLDSEGRARLRLLLAGARFVVVPTSEAIRRVESRLAPGTIPLAVACSAGLGVDQTVAVTEVLAARGYEVTPHLAARQVRTARHLDGILHRLARRAVRRVLVIQGEGPSGEFTTSGRLLASMRGHADAPAEIGIAGHPEGHPGLDGELLATRLLDRSAHATFVSTEVSLNPGRLLAWVAEMRVRGLGLPIEVGIPGVVPSQDLRRENPGMGPARSLPHGRMAEWYNPTELVAELAAQQVVERLDVGGLRVETMNQIEATATWRQQIYDLAYEERVV